MHIKAIVSCNRRCRATSVAPSTRSTWGLLESVGARCGTRHRRVLEPVAGECKFDSRVVSDAVGSGKSVYRIDFQVTERRGHGVAVAANRVFSLIGVLACRRFPHASNSIGLHRSVLSIHRGFAHTLLPYRQRLALSSLTGGLRQHPQQCRQRRVFRHCPGHHHQVSHSGIAERGEAMQPKADAALQRLCRHLLAVRVRRGETAMAPGDQTGAPWLAQDAYGVGE